MSGRLMSVPCQHIHTHARAHTQHTLLYSDTHNFTAVAVLGKIFGGPGPSSFGRQQRLSEIYYRTN